MWYVVVFTTENTVAVIPKSWFIEKTSECFWPPRKFKREKLQKFIKHRYLPEDNWSPYKANILGQYGDYEEAMKKLKKAQQNDKLSSTDQDEEHNNRSRKRKRIPNSKFVDSDTDSTDRDEHSGDSLSYPEWPNNPNTNESNDKGSQSLKCSSKNTAPSNTSINSQAKSSNNNRTYMGDQQSKTTTKRKVGTGFYRTYSRSLSPADVRSTEKSRSQQANRSQSISFSQNSAQEHVESQQHKTSLGTSNQPVISILNSMISSEQKFREEVFRKLNVINLKLLDLEKQIGTMKKDSNEDLIPINEEGVELLNLLPLDAQKLDQMKTALDNQDVKNFLIRELSRVGGTDTSDMLKRLMYKIFTNEVGNEFSWDGAKGKKRFKKLKLADVITNAVRLNQSTKNATESDIIVCVKKWLVRCKDRMKNAEKKRLSLNEDRTSNADSSAD